MPRLPLPSSPVPEAATSRLSAAADPHLSSFSAHSGPCRPLRPFAFTFPLPLHPPASPCLLPEPCCLLASRASLRTFQSTGFLKDKGIALSSKVIYGPKGLQFIQFLLFFPLLFAFFCMFLSPFAVCCLFQLPLPLPLLFLLLLLLLALVVLKSLGVGQGLGLGAE